MSYDTVIRGGTIVDGTGAPAFRGDVAVKNGVVAQVGKVTGQAARTIDAEGLVVCPGFFDMHTHYDAQVCWDPMLTPSSWHGVTTVLTGNCGYAIAPAKPSDRDYLAHFMSNVEGIPLEVLKVGAGWRWGSFGDYLGAFKSRLGINVAPMVGHSALRYYAMGPASLERAATLDEIEAMRRLLRECLAAGAAGLSTSRSTRGGTWFPVPSRQSTQEELVALCQVLHEGSHGIAQIDPPHNLMIDRDDMALIAAMGKASGRPVIWSQLMHDWDRPNGWRSSLELMDEAAERGVSVYALSSCKRLDREFNLRRTNMFDYFLPWKQVLAAPHDEKKRLLASPEVRARLREAVTPEGLMRHGRRPDSLEVKRTILPKNKSYQGRLVVDLLKGSGKDWIDFMLDLSLEEDLDTQLIFNGVVNGDPEAVAQIIQAPHCLPGASDAGAHLDAECGADYISVLLGHWVRERGVMSLEEAVRRLTSMSAGALGIADRGALRPGMAADVLVFDPKTFHALPREAVRDLPGGGERIIQRAEGIHVVIVNGEVLLRDGKGTGALPGKLVGGPAR